MRRVNLSKAAPDLYKAMFALDNAAQKFAVSAGITNGFLHVLKLRASQINGCAYCLRMHTRNALAAGESSDHISVLPAWHESSYFTQSERASLALIEAVTQISEGHIADAVYTDAAHGTHDPGLAKRAAEGEGGVLRTVVGVVDNPFARTPIPNRHVHGLDREVRNGTLAH